MAALAESARPEVVSLADLAAHDLQPLFAEEISTWRRRFAWDFRSSAELLSRYVQLQSLYGCALRLGHEVIGYGYYVCEGQKGLIGDFFVAERHGTHAHETLLLETILGDLMRAGGVKRIESQLMMLRNQSASLPMKPYLRRHDRLFMQLNAREVLALRERRPLMEVKFSPWSDRYTEEMAHLISSAYRGHVDSEINDQYRSISGARTFLSNIVRYPGCGTFAPASSTIAIDSATGRLCGACLSSMVANISGHVTQLCVLPALRNAHLGYELLRRTLQRLTAGDATTVSLTVTSSNVSAIQLYQTMGFRSEARFPALVWEGF